MTTLGDELYGGASGTPTRLAGPTSATKQFQTSTGTVSAAQAPAWGTIASGDMPAGTTSARGALQLDGTAGDIVALAGSAAAGATGKAADAGHAHPSTGVVTGVTAADASVVVAGTSAAPTVATGTLDVIAAQHPPVAAVSLNSQKITNLATPTVSTDAVTKAYADAIAQGLSVKPSVQEATAAALPSNVYSNGASGAGATLTAVATGVLTVDGVTVALNDRVLVKNEAAPASNGLYACTVAGAIGVAYVLTRATDMNTAAQVPGAFCFTEQGTANAGAGFTVASPGPFTIGTTAITWTQFSGAGEITAGTGLSKSGNTLSLAADSTASDIKALGAQAAGSSGLAPNSDHVHPTTGLVLTSSLPLAIASGGTGAATAAAAFNALSPMTTTGDLSYESATATASRLAGPTSATKQFLTSTGTGSAAQAPAWGTIGQTDVQDPLGIGFNCTCGQVTQVTTTALAAANFFYYVQLVSGGYASTNFYVDISVQSGNMCVAIYTNTGGTPGAPGARLWTSGSISTPGAGLQAVSMGATYTPNKGDWLAVAFDNTTATLLGVATGRSTIIFPDYVYYQNVGSLSAPATATPVSTPSAAPILFTK